MILYTNVRTFNLVYLVNRGSFAIVHITKFIFIIIIQTFVFMTNQFIQLWVGIYCFFFLKLSFIKGFCFFLTVLFALRTQIYSVDILLWKVNKLKNSYVLLLTIMLQMQTIFISLTTMIQISRVLFYSKFYKLTNL